MRCLSLTEASAVDPDVISRERPVKGSVIDNSFSSVFSILVELEVLSSRI